MKLDNDDQVFDKPPFFKSWKTIYYLVVGNLVLMILLFYLFTVAFQ